MRLETRITPQDRRLLALVGWLGGAALFVGLVLRPAWDAHSQAWQHHEEAVRQQQAMLAEIDGADAHAADRDRALENARQAVLGLQPALTSDELDALVTGLALDHNLTPVALQISAPTAPALPGSGDALPDPPESGSLSMRQVSGTVEGSRADCLALLDELARRRPGLHLLHVTLGDAAWLKDGQQDADVRMEYELAVYLYDTEAYAG